jgi:hypothetical protein
MVHLLALGPLTAKSLANKTRAPIELVDKVMPKIAKMDITGRQWILLDDAYKELDIWDFPYMTTNDRDKAIKNAKEAFKRQNLASRDEVWFMLIEPDKRDEARRNAISPTPAPSDKEAAERAISLPPPIDASKLAKQAAKPQKAAKAGKQSNLMSRLKAGGKITAPKTKKNPPAAAAAAAVPKAKGTVGRPPKNPAAPKTTKATAKSTAANNSKIKSAEIITDSDDDADMEDAVTLAPPKPAPKKPSPAPRVTHALPPKPVVSAVPTKQLAEAPRLSPKRKAPASKEPATKSPAKKPKTLANSPEPPAKKEPAYSKKASRERAYSPEPVQKSRASARDHSPEPAKSRSYAREHSPEPVKKKNRVPMPPVGTPEQLKKSQQNAASPEPAKSLAYAREHSPEPVKKKNRVPLPPVGTPEPAKKVQQSAAYSPEPAKNKKESRGRDRSPEPTRRRGSFQDSPDRARKEYRVRDRSPEPARRGRDRSPEPTRRRGSFQGSPDRVVKEYRVRDRSPEPARRGRDRSPEPVKRTKNTSGPRNRSPEPARRQDSQDRAVKRDPYKKSPSSETNGYSNKTANKTLPRPSSQRSDNSSDQKRTPSDRTPSDSRSPSYRGSTDSQSPRDSLNGRGKVQGQQPRYAPAAVNGAKRKGDRDEPVPSNKPARSASSSGNGSQRDRDRVSNGSEKGLKRRQDNADNERPAKRRSVSPPPSAKKPDPLTISRAKQFKEDYAQLQEFYQNAQQLPVGSKEEQAAVKKVINLTNELIAMKKAIWQKSQEEINEQPLSRIGRSESVRAR